MLIKSLLLFIFIFLYLDSVCFWQLTGVLRTTDKTVHIKEKHGVAYNLFLLLFFLLFSSCFILDFTVVFRLLFTHLRSWLWFVTLPEGFVGAWAISVCWAAFWQSDGLRWIELRWVLMESGGWGRIEMGYDRLKCRRMSNLGLQGCTLAIWSKIDWDEFRWFEMGWERDSGGLKSRCMSIEQSQFAGLHYGNQGQDGLRWLHIWCVDIDIVLPQVAPKGKTGRELKRSDYFILKILCRNIICCRIHCLPNRERQWPPYQRAIW